MCDLNTNTLGKFKNKIKTKEGVMTKERLNHITEKHNNEYKQLSPYLSDIIRKPDYVLGDNKHEDTIILLKQIGELGKNGRVVIKLALRNDEKHPKNSIITLMKLSERTWKQTIKNRGNIIYEKD